MGNRKEWLRSGILLIGLICFLIAFVSLKASGQCSVEDIEFSLNSPCNSITNKFAVVVTCELDGNPSEVLVDLQGLHYPFAQKKFTNISTGEFSFVYYDDADGQTRNISITVTLKDGDCSDETLTKTYSYQSPATCNCDVFLNLTGNVATGKVLYYLAQDSIHSSQIFTQGSNVIISGQDKVMLLPGFEFHPSENNSLKITNKGCNQ